MIAILEFGQLLVLVVGLVFLFKTSTIQGKSKSTDWARSVIKQNRHG